MQRFLGKMASYMSSLMPSATQPSRDINEGLENGGDDGVSDALTAIFYAISSNEDTSEISKSEPVKSLVEFNCPLDQKYMALDVLTILQRNNRSVQELKSIISALHIILKFAQQLIKKHDQRREQWRVVNFGNSIVKKKVQPLNGFELVFKQLGYTSMLDYGLSFPEGQEPDHNNVIHLMADMIVFRKEIREYLLDSHLHPEHIEKYVPQQTRGELLKLHTSGLQCVEDEHNDMMPSTIGQPALVSSVESPPREWNNSNSIADESDPVVTATTITSAAVLEGQREQENFLGAGDNAAKGVAANMQEAEAIQDLPHTMTLECGSGTLTSSSSSKMLCAVCGDDAVVFCKDCQNKPLCDGCNQSWHKHPNRRNHRIDLVSALASLSLENHNGFHIDGTYGISASARQSPTRMGRKQAAQLVNQNTPVQRLNNTDRTHFIKRDQQEEQSYLLGQTGNLAQQIMNDYQHLDYQRQMSNQQQLGNFFYPPREQYPVSSLAFQSQGSYSSVYPKQDGTYVQSPSHAPLQYRPNMASFNPGLSQQGYPIDNPASMANYQRHFSPHIHPVQSNLPHYVQQQVNEQPLRIGFEHHQPDLVWPMDVSQPYSLKRAPHAYNFHPYMLQQHHIGEMVGPKVFGTGPMANSMYLQQFNQSLVQPPTEQQYFSQTMRPGGSVPIGNFNPPHANVLTQSQLDRLPGSYNTGPVPQAEIFTRTWENVRHIQPMPNLGHQSDLISQEQRKSSHSLPSTSSNILNFKVEALMKIPDVKLRKEQCETDLRQTQHRIKILENEINSIMLENDEDVLEFEEFKHKMKQKSMLVKEISCLESLLKEMASQTMLMKLNATEPVQVLHQEGVDDLSESLIHYPPEIDMSSTRLTGKTSQVTKTNENELRSLDSNPRNVALQNSDVKVGRSLVNSSNKQVARPGTSSQHESPNIGARNPQEILSDVMSEMSYAPLIPPHIKKEFPEDLLQLTFPPPKITARPEGKQWHCVHCTFINLASSHVCEMCNKTSDNPKFVNSEDEDEDDDNLITTVPGVMDDSLGPDALLDLLEPITNLQQQQTNPSTHTEDDEEEDYSDPDETPLIVARIVGFQEQVMREKKKAQKEFMQKQRLQEKLEQQQDELNRADEAPPPSLWPVSNSPSTTQLTTQPQFGTGARPKERSNLQSGCARSEQSNTCSSEYNTPPSGTSPSPPSPSLQVGKGQQPPPSQPGQEEAIAKMTNLEDSLARLNEISLIDNLQSQGAELAKLIKLADQENYSVEATMIAVTMCHRMTPIEWLRINWNKNVNKIITMATINGNQLLQNCVGDLSYKEAESAYLSCHGNMKDAVQMCMNKRTELYNKLSNLGDFPREEILAVMKQCQGDFDDCEHVLNEAKLQPFVTHIWAQKEIKSGHRSVLHNVSTSEMCHSFSTSVISHCDFQKLIKDKKVDIDRRIRLILVEGRMKSWGRAELVIRLLDNDLRDDNISLEDVVEAVRNAHDTKSALAYLQQECTICMDIFPMSKIRYLLTCQCKMCENCLKMNFEIDIREKHVRHWKCPVCSQPDLDSDRATDYLQYLLLQLQPMINGELLELFETKIRDWHLQKNPDFRWCAHCAEGFLAEDRGAHLRMTCPHCREQTCYNCKKQWEPQHDGLTCEQFATWKIDNDPVNQSVGLAKHLDENGIDCPSCKMRFALAKGGCMHFKCPQCGHEFCSGCSEPYHHKNMCTKFQICKNLGLHSHCPRDCFSYLRDYQIPEIQGLLSSKGIAFNVNIPRDQQDHTHCPVMEQKEFDTGKKDEKCGKATAQGQAGLCEGHYKEYLVDIINRNGLDPVVLMGKEQMVALLQKNDQQYPAQKNRTDEAYRTELMKIIVDNLPLRER